MALIGEIATEAGRKAGADRARVYSVTKYDGFVPSDEYFNKQVFSRDLSGYKLVEEGTFAYATIHLDEGSVGIAPETALISPMYTAFKINLRRVEPRYLIRLLKSPRALQAYTILGEGSANRRRSIPFKRLATLEVPIPELDEQRSIADALDRVDALRAKRREAIAHLDSLNQSIFLEMFGDPVCNLSGYEERALVELCFQTDDIKCGPFGTQLSKSEYKDSGIPLWGIKQVNAGFATLPPEFLDEQTAERLSAYSVVPGDIVMTRKGDVGKCAVYPRTRSAGIMHSDVLRVRLGASVETEFISHQLHHSPAIRRQVDLISQGAIMKGINVTKLKSLRVLTPPLEMQQEFTRRVAAVEDLKTKHRAQLAELDDLFLSLQDRAFKGEL